MTKEVLEGFSRFICLGCILLKSLNVFYYIGLTFSITRKYTLDSPQRKAEDALMGAVLAQRGTLITES